MTASRYIFISLFFFFSLPGMISAQGIQTEFGKNRIQNQQFKWQQYETDNFVTYWYEGGRTIGEFVVQIAERDQIELQSILEYKLNEKIQILVYNDLNDLKQSNLGNQETFYNTGGTTRIVGNKVFVHFNGDRNNLRKQIREGVTHIYLSRMMFGGNLQEIVQNAVLLNLPQWFTNGLVAYVGENWNTSLDNRLRDGILNEKYTTFLDVVNEDPQLAGHSLWHYIGQNYGQSTVANLLYLTRINRSVESGFLYVMGSTFHQTSENWFDFYYQRYKSDEVLGTTPAGTPLTIQNPKNHRVSQVKISPNGNRIAYVTNDAGKFQVHTQELKMTPEPKLVLKEGLRNTFQEVDENYPLLAWNPKSGVLTVLFEKKNRFQLVSYNPKSGKAETTTFKKMFDRITSINYSKSTQLVISALKDGQSDIYTMSTAGKNVTQLTSDAFDDHGPQAVEIDGRSGILFSSNRNSTNLRAPGPLSMEEPRDFDVFFYPLETDNPELVRVTDTPFASERHPVQLDSTYFGFLSDVNGIDNRFSGMLREDIAYYEKVVVYTDGSQVTIPQDSIPASDTQIDTSYLQSVYELMAFTHPNTAFNKNIIEHSVSQRKQKVAELHFHNGAYRIFVRQLDGARQVELPPTSYREFVVDKAQKETVAPVVPMNNVLDSIPLWQVPEEFEEPTTDSPAENEVEDNTPPVEQPVEVKPEAEPKEEPKEDRIDIDNYFFQSEFDNNETPAAMIIEDEDGNITLQNPATVFSEFIEPVYEPVDFSPADVNPYRRKFKMEYLAVQLDNSLMFDGRNNRRFSPEFYEYQGLGILVKTSMIDIHEDFRFQGGFRVPIRFDGVEYFLTFEDRRKKLDKRFSLYRRSNVDNEDLGNFNSISKRTISHIAETRLSWPLNIFTSVRGNFFVRTDRNITLATDFGNLETPRLDEQRIGFQLEYVYDNTTDISVNIKNGTRFKVFVEMQKKFDLRILEPDANFSLDFGEGFLHSFGFDARHYLKIDKYSILAGRAAFASSFGAEKILYFLGGVDNWIISDSNEEIPVPANTGFAYQTLASNMRGFKNNIRNGNSYFILNLEARVPIFNYFARHPLKSSFLRNFQLVGFVDMGTAWQGVSPFQDDNPLNTVLIGNQGSPINVEVNYFRNPIVYGLGAGLRTMIFGYFVRLDYAWGVETGVFQEGQFYISLGKDF